ncbi:hypothetical protein [Streptomyces sp. NPDC001381]|uniref:hypothetical protein n=1 Tax=Streptomyces sp. NPDC001381 TaxID=3364567 RepID=UPI0036B123C0
MLATAERLHPNGALGAVQTIWHAPARPRTCDGDCDFHRIDSDSDTGIGRPGGLRNVPVELDQPGERWCSTCLAAAPWQDAPLVPTTAPREAR